MSKSEVMWCANLPFCQVVFCISNIIVWNSSYESKWHMLPSSGCAGRSGRGAFLNVWDPNYFLESYSPHEPNSEMCLFSFATCWKTEVSSRKLHWFQQIEACFFWGYIFVVNNFRCAELLEQHHWGHRNRCWETISVSRRCVRSVAALLTTGWG